jgi:hypothetical protein
MENKSFYNLKERINKGIALSSLCEKNNGTNHKSNNSFVNVIKTNCEHGSNNSHANSNSNDLATVAEQQFPDHLFDQA